MITTSCFNRINNYKNNINCNIMKIIFLKNTQKICIYIKLKKIYYWINLFIKKTN